MVRPEAIPMEVLIVNQSEVSQLLPMRECLEVVRESLGALARGSVILPLRPVLWLPEKVGALGMMPAYAGELHVMGLKVVSVFPGNHGTAYDSHMGAVMIFETKHGQPLAIMDASEITAIRTAAASRSHAPLPKNQARPRLEPSSGERTWICQA
jgi:ornithine cyclodeaminase/alanine dehydrogenase-like protein (mu-crystallin family)